MLFVLIHTKVKWLSMSNFYILQGKYYIHKQKQLNNSSNFCFSYVVICLFY